MNPDELMTLLREALGEASMCWSNIEGAGTFQADRAIEVAERFANRIPLQQPPVFNAGCDLVLGTDPSSAPEVTQ